MDITTDGVMHTDSSGLFLRVAGIEPKQVDAYVIDLIMSILAMMCNKKTSCVQYIVCLFMYFLHRHLNPIDASTGSLQGASKSLLI